MNNSKNRALLICVLLVLMALVACAPRPVGVENDPSSTPVVEPTETEAEAPSAIADPDVYDLESEGSFEAPASDIVFREDELPPRPEDLEANALGVDEVESEDIPATPAQEISAEATVQTPIAPSVQTPVQPNPGATMARGFRVQLLALESRSDAETAAVEAEQRLRVDVHVVFEAPYFKVRAGNFPERGDALQLRDRAKSNGYSNAWVVTDEIYSEPGSGS